VLKFQRFQPLSTSIYCQGHYCRSSHAHTLSQFGILDAAQLPHISRDVVAFRRGGKEKLHDVYTFMTDQFQTYVPSYIFYTYVYFRTFFRLKSADLCFGFWFSQFLAHQNHRYLCYLLNC